MPPEKSLPPPGSWRCWLLAARPKTLTAAISPVLLGTAFAIHADRFHAASAICALLGAVLIQIGTNFVNDAQDAIKGTDTAGRLGPPRACASGLLSARSVWRGALVVFALAVLPGLYLAWRAGWVIIAIGAVAILCGIAYTAGRHSLATLGLGDLFTLIFFGPVAVAGTFAVQALTWSPIVAAFGFVPGIYSVALIAINNLRDWEQDKLAGRRTIPVRFGERAARWQIAFSMLLPTAAPWLLPGIPTHLAFIGTLIALVAARPVVMPILRGCRGRALNPLLAAASAANLCMSAYLSVILIRHL